MGRGGCPLSCNAYSGVVLVIGGYPYDDGLVESFDPASGVVGPWKVGEAVQRLTSGRRPSPVVAAVEDRVLVAGVSISGDANTTELFVGPAGNFTQGPSMQHGRHYAATALIGQSVPLLPVSLL